MIVKVQFPLASNEPQPLALIYNQDRSVCVQIPITDPLRARMGGRKKRFFHAEVSDFGVEIGDAVPEESW